jgi:hypothetical protein
MNPVPPITRARLFDIPHNPTSTGVLQPALYETESESARIAALVGELTRLEEEEEE